MSRDFLLVDGVLRQDALQWLYGAGDSIDVIPLYNGTRWDGVKSSVNSGLGWTAMHPY